VEHCLDRQTQHISRMPAVNIHHATRFAERRGTPLNAFVTINFTEVGIGAGASRVFRKLLSQRFAPWLRRSSDLRNRAAPTYVWTIENAASTLAAHWLVHLPDGSAKAFARKLRSWLEGLADTPLLARTVQVKRVYNVIGARRYILKGVDPAWADHLGIRPSDQGIVNGKRSGFSRNLGPAARKSGGYTPRRQFQLRRA
jgi:hypothetical protein